MRRLADGLDRAVSLPAHTQQRPPRCRKHTRRSCPSRHGHGPLCFLAQGDDAFASASATACKPWPTSISLRGAPKHNLKDVSVEIPGLLTVMTGVSGSGTYNKSSLPTINLPCLGVHSISYDILPPTVAIKQCKTRGSAKLTVGGILTQAEGPGLAVLPHSPALSATPEGCNLPSLRRGAMM